MVVLNKKPLGSNVGIYSSALLVTGRSELQKTNDRVKGFTEDTSGSYHTAHIWLRGKATTEGLVNNFVLTHSVNIPWRKPLYADKTHNFNQTNNLRREKRLPW